MKNLHGITLGDTIPNFGCETSEGPMTLHEYFGEKWGLLCSHPDDFTPVCTTEMGELARLDNEGEFAKRNMKVIALSCNDVNSHMGWIKDVECYSKSTVKYPIIADKNREIAMNLGMLSQDDLDTAGLPLTVRSVFIVDPSKKIKLMLTYPASTGRNFVEILRVIDSLQVTFNQSMATPVNWQVGDKACLLPTVGADEAEKRFGKALETKELPSSKSYLRMATPSS